jgi:hypothetical protein
MRSKVNSIISAIVMITACSTSVLALDLFGTARSVRDLEAAKWDLGDKVDDYNRDRKGRQWYGMFVYCVCEKARNKIYYGGKICLTDNCEGPTVARFRDRVRYKCGECYASPKAEIVTYGRETARAANKKRKRELKGAASGMRKYLRDRRQ